MADWASQGALGAGFRRFEQFLPLSLFSFGGRHQQSTLKPFPIGKNHPIATDRAGYLDFRATGVNADCGARRARVGRPSVRLLDLEQLHASRTKRETTRRSRSDPSHWGYGR